VNLFRRGFFRQGGNGALFVHLLVHGHVLLHALTELDGERSVLVDARLS
jgi:hypothetical protein